MVPFQTDYEVDPLLVSIMQDTLVSNAQETVTNAHILINGLGYLNLDTDILSELSNIDMDKSSMGTFIYNRVQTTTLNHLHDSGIILNDNAPLNVINAVMIFFISTVNLDPIMADVISSLISPDDDTSLSTEKLAKAVTMFTSIPYTEVEENLVDVSDSLLEAIVNKLQNELTIEIDTDITNIETLFNLIDFLIKVNKDYSDTYLLNMLVAGDLPYSTFEEYSSVLTVIEPYIESDPYKYALEVTALLYLCDETKNNIRQTYKEQFEEQLLMELDINKLQTISNHVNNLITQIEDGVKHD